MNTTKHSHHGRGRLAFTLIEMLTVITIMSIIAALVVTMAQAAAQRKKIVAVNGEKQRLVSLIGNYQAGLNYYPPDNGALISNAYGSYYDALAATNPLIYELVGATNVPGMAKGNMIVFNSPTTTSYLLTGSYAGVFNRAGIANCDTTEPHDFFQPGPALKEYTNYSAATFPPICGLVVPVEFTNAHIPNFWHYDSSTTNRHNMASFDLWAEFSMGSKNGHLIMITNGNW